MEKQKFDPKTFRDSITLEKLNSQLDEFVKIVYKDNDFNFRPNQKETIINLIYNSLAENKVNQIVEAPTGTGKSIINLLCASFLAHFYNKSSYILCSDLFLYSQYEEAIKSNEYFDKNIAYIKGQYGNYKCNINGEDFRSGVCRVAQAPWNIILQPYFKEYKNNPEKCEYPCALNCDYCKQKIKIREAKIVVTTYQNLLYCYLNFDYSSFTGQNRVECLKEAKITMPFSLRPKTYCFCDEAHNIPAIVQAHFTPKLKLSDFEIHEELYNYAKFNKISAPSSPGIISHNELYTNVENYFENETKLYETFVHYYEIVSKKCIKRNELLSILNNYAKQYFNILKGIELVIRNKISVKLNSKEKLTRDEYAILNICNKYSEFYCKFSDVINALNVVGGKYLLKQYVEDENEKYIELHCMREDYLCSRYFLNYHRYRIFTSATIGNKSQFDQNVGIPKSGFFSSSLTKIPSYFNFDNSPIKFLNKYPMSYKFKNDSINFLSFYINEICGKLYPNKRGIIQTGSYSIMQNFIELVNPNISKRFIYYRNSREKEIAIKKYKNSKNGILIGPSLNQGIDLPHDLCRFIIIAKVPYMNITDEFVKEKIKLFPKWYNSQASIEIIQGIGRGVRAQGDFCETFILDKCFGDLYIKTKSQYPDEIKNRLKTFTIFRDIFKEAA